MSDDVTQLLAKHRRALRARRFARTMLLLVLIGTLVISALSMRNALRNLALRTDVFALSFMSGMQPALPRFRALAVASAERVEPVYQEALAEEMKTRRAELDTAIDVELARLDAHANARWGDISAGIETLALEQAEVLRAGFTNIVDDAQAERMQEYYGEALYLALQEALGGVLREHAGTAERVGESLSLLLDDAEEVSALASSREMLGVMLELSGLYMQQSVLGEEAY